MKNLLYLLVLPLFFFISCSEDNNSPSIDTQREWIKGHWQATSMHPENSTTAYRLYYFAQDGKYEYARLNIDDPSSHIFYNPGGNYNIVSSEELELRSESGISEYFPFKMVDVNTFYLNNVKYIRIYIYTEDGK